MEKNNPFFKEWKTHFGVPPFTEIDEEHYLAAFKKGMADQNIEIDEILSNKKSPSFSNTIETLDRSGRFLTKVSLVFFSLKNSDNTEGIQDIAKVVIPLLTQHRDNITLNEKLFEKVETVYEKRDSLQLDTVKRRLLKKIYRNFVRNGANLKGETRAEFRKINEELSLLILNFGDNLLAETNNFKMVIENRDDLAGLPKSVITAAAETAKTTGDDGKWVFTLHNPSWIPFLQYSEKRELREKIYKAYINRGNNSDENDNKKIIARIADLRVKRARLLGYKTHADFRLETYMAKTPENVLNRLNTIWEAALPVAKKERDDLQELIDKEGSGFELQSWDWWYYTEKLRKSKFDIDESELRAYFELDNVIKGAFFVANKLYGIQFEERMDIPKYHPEAKTFEVKEADGTHLGILITDYFPRAGKRGGAWCGTFRDQYYENGNKVTPVVFNVMNFSRPSEGMPALLSFDEVTTLFHEFGHALHVHFSDVKYNTLKSVAQDFVELPSQIMQHWVSEPEVLKVYARHYKTGDIIPEDIIRKLKESEHFNQGFKTVEYLAASFLDMAWHTLTEPGEVDTISFETACLSKIGLIPEIISRYRSTYFKHIVGGYDAGYYAYIWAEVLDCDAYEAFEESGNIFNKKLGESFRRNILEKGDSEDPMALYVRFRGVEPKIDGLMKNRGLIRQ